MIAVLVLGVAVRVPATPKPNTEVWISSYAAEDTDA